jgi:hypothetical protein
MSATRLWTLLASATIALAASAAPAPPSWQFLSADALGMGGTSIGIHRGATDWSANPALLPDSDITPNGYDAHSLAWGVKGSGLFSSHDAFGVSAHDYDLSVGTRSVSGSWGLGAGFDRYTLGDFRRTEYGAGYGRRLASPQLEGFNVGVSVKHMTFNDRYTESANSDYSGTTVNLGATYSPPWLRDSLGKSPFLGGIVVEDITNQTNDIGWGRRVNLGASIQLTPHIRAATDEYGLGSTNRFWSKGIEYATGPLALRAGDMDGHGTYGLGYAPASSNWKVDFAHTQFGGERINLLTGTYLFGSGGQ